MTRRRKSARAISRARKGVSLAKRFDGEFPERFAEEIFHYLSVTEKEFPEASRQFEQPIMDRKYFMDLADRFRSPHLWKFEDGEWNFVTRRSKIRRSAQVTFGNGQYTSHRPA